MAPLWLPALAETALRARFGAAALERGRGLAVGPCEPGQDGAAQTVQALVQGSRQAYRSRLRLAPGSLLRGDCECRHALGGAACKHQAALALAWRRELAGAAPRPVDSAAAAGLRVASLFEALPADAPVSRLAELLPLLQAWQQQHPDWALAAAEQALPRLQRQLLALQAEPGWAEGGAQLEANWLALAEAVVAELFAAWARLGAQPAAAAERYLALLDADPLGLIEPARALSLLGDALARRAGELLRQRWERGGEAQPYLRHLRAIGDAAERLRVLAQCCDDAAGHAAYIEALLDAGRGREALAAAEQAQRHWPQDRALESLLLALYERDGWDEQALALRRAAFVREPTRAAYAELLRLAPDADAERAQLQPLLAQSAAGRRLRLQLWAEQADWQQGLAWLREQALVEPALWDACGDWLLQLPAAHDAEAVEWLKALLQRSLPLASPPYVRERRWVAEVCRRQAAPAARLWLAWLRVEHRRRADFLATLPTP